MTKKSIRKAIVLVLVLLVVLVQPMAALSSSYGTATGSDPPNAAITVGESQPGEAAGANEPAVAEAVYSTEEQEVPTDLSLGEELEGPVVPAAPEENPIVQQDKVVESDIVTPAEQQESPVEDVLTTLEPEPPVTLTEQLEIAEGASTNITVPEDGQVSFNLHATGGDEPISWSIPDNQLSVQGSVYLEVSTGRQAKLSYQPDANFNGRATFQVQASDNNGETASIVVEVTVTPVYDSPVNTGSPTISGTCTVGKSITANAGDWIDDEDGTLTYHYQWQRASDASGSGAADIAGATGSSYTLTGADLFVRIMVTAEDSDALSSTPAYSAWYAVSPNSPPVITQEGTATLTLDEDASTASLALEATDVDGDPLTWSISSPASKGTASVSNGNLSYRPNANFNGSDQFTVEVSDGNGNKDTIIVEVTVNPINDAPVISEGETATMTVDEDAATSATLALGATDADGDTLTWSISSPPSHGTATVDNGTVSYRPAADYNGADTFKVQVSDGKGGSDTITITVTINAVNDAPVISEGETATMTVDEDAATSATLALGATDADGDILTWSISSPAGHGTATVDNGTVSYNPTTADYNGSDQFIVEVSDGKGGTDSITITVTVNAVNDQPSFTKGADQEINEDAEAQSVANWAKDINWGPPNEVAQGAGITFDLTVENDDLFAVQPTIDKNGNSVTPPRQMLTGFPW